MQINETNVSLKIGKFLSRMKLHWISLAFWPFRANLQTYQEFVRNHKKQAKQRKVRLNKYGMLFLISFIIPSKRIVEVWGLSENKIKSKIVKSENSCTCYFKNSQKNGSLRSFPLKFPSFPSDEYTSFSLPCPPTLLVYKNYLFDSYVLFLLWYESINGFLTFLKSL